MTQITENKYNLQVGDIIVDKGKHLDKKHEILDVKAHGARLNPYNGHDTWDYINYNLDSGKWGIERLFPEKWCFRADNIEDAKEVSSWITRNRHLDDNITSWYTPQEIVNFYFHYPAYDNCIHTSEHVLKGHTPISFEQFKQKYLNTPNMEKNIIGYKLKEEFEKYEKVVITILQPHYNAVNFPKVFRENIEKYGFLIGKPSTPTENSYEKFLKESGIFDIWFEPVYEAQEIKMTIGTPAKEIKITKDGVWHEGEVFDSTFLSYLAGMFRTDSSRNLHVKKVWVGCEQGTEVTKAEVEKVIAEYNKLNK